MNCIACKCPTDKYKCPRCFMYYCSLPCYKKHREEPCQPPPAEESVAEETKKEERLPMLFKTQDTVRTDKLEALEQSENIKNLLCNPHLRNFLKEVDSAPNAWKAIRAAMQEPLFIEFADECMKIVEPYDGKDDVCF